MSACDLIVAGRIRVLPTCGDGQGMPALGTGSWVTDGQVITDLVGIRMMATLTQLMLTCDLCGNAKDVRTRTVGLDGQAYEIDLCPKDSNGLSQAAASYMSKARKIPARRSPRRSGRKPRSRAENAAIRERVAAAGRNVSGQGRAGSTQEKAKAGRSEQQAAKTSGAKARASGSTQEAQASRSGLQRMEAASTEAAKTSGTHWQKGIYVYGILPADVEVAAEIPGIGEHPGLLRVICSDGLAALISEVDVPGRLGSADDLRTHSEILDETATEVPVLPLRFGTVLTSEDAVVDELLAAHHDEFANALEELEGRAEFLVKGRYVEEAVLGEVLPGNKPTARLQDNTQGTDPDTARDADIERGEIINEAVTAKREQDTRALEEAMKGLCVASVVREPVQELDAVHVAFLIDVGQESELEQVIENLARDWEGRIEVQLLGPMAAYDFVRTEKPEGPARTRSQVHSTSAHCRVDGPQ